MARVVLQGVSKVFPGPVTAVNRLDLEVEDGQLTVLVGPSGGGKTTTLRLIAGLEKPSTGRIRIGDREVTDCPPHRRGIAMVFQRPALYPHLTVRQNLVFGVRRRGVERIVEDVARMLDIVRLLDRLPDQLSGGEQQRVALGKAIVRRPAVFLLDEPLSGLDARLRGRMRIQLRELLQRQQSATLYVTHDQREAMALADRVVVMDAGQVRQSGTPKDIYTAPNSLFTARFFGELPINTLRGRLTARAEGLRIDGTDWVLPIPRKLGPARSCGDASEIVLGIRPECIEILPSPCPALVPGTMRECRLIGDRWMVRVGLGPGKTGQSVELLATALRLGAPLEAAVGMRINWSRVHWFDGRSGMRISTN